MIKHWLWGKRETDRGRRGRRRGGGGDSRKERGRERQVKKEIID